mgnify:CR=1 FL=1
MIQVIVTVPCYNEFKRLDEDEFTAFSRSHPNMGFMFVNDGSVDRTLDKLQSLVEADPTRFMLCNLPSNRGKAEAVRAGIIESLEFKPMYVGIWDADLATPLWEIPRFHEIMEQNPNIKMVLGARVRLMGRTIERPPARHYLGRLSATMISLCIGLPVYDTQCGAKMFRVDDRLRDLFSQPFISSWIFDVEIIARFMNQNSGILPADAIYELPLDEWIHKGGSKIKAKDYIIALKELFAIRKKYF